jgi:hypothetical protein
MISLIIEKDIYSNFFKRKEQECFLKIIYYSFNYYEIHINIFIFHYSNLKLENLSALNAVEHLAIVTEFLVIASVI